ncbi:Inositol 2-dehydrogenase [Pirellula sp. SH-Sr6A]|uniref:Gfo/Idh/MocA family protein n=1 Tax=Pirellula sp. SH-Sr6A TaxID=1632865 RepID=UPI00078BEF06|nr:Gfo/Idh/MocA family oxidoreductase [Pirellula sp. SH-Sr6A]AMV34798.1 Inositol 2-dehydrogenase [Pirellula sp. SH-Sr6A]
MNHSRRRMMANTLSCTSLSVLSPLISLASTAPENRPIRMGQIGVAHAHASKLSVYRRSPDFEVIGIVEEDEALRRSATDKEPYRGLPWMTREELLAQPGLQAVLIETEIRDLLRHSAACLDAGCHVHIDKPAGTSLPELEQVLEIARRGNRIVQMGYMYRYNPAIRLLHEFLDAGWLGDVFEVHAVMSKQMTSAERKVPAAYPGGMMFELGCHLIDLVVRILGEPQSVYVSSKHSSSIADTLQDNMLAVLEYPTASATVKTSCLEVDGGNRRHLVVCGTEGTFHIEPLDNPKVRLLLDRPRGKFRKGEQTIELPRYTRYVDDALDMAKAIRSEKDFAYSYDHDLAVQRTVLKASGLWM